MNKRKKERIKKGIVKVGKVLLILAMIYIIYSVGRVRGLVDGVNVMLYRNNETMCDLMDNKRDTDGFCILGEENKTYKYRHYIDCGWEKFKMIGEKKPPILLETSLFIQRLIYYPAMGC